MSNAPELKSCPFCGSASICDSSYSIESPVEYFGQYRCADCDAVGPLSEYKYDNLEEAQKDAADMWNTRAIAAQGEEQ